MTKKNLLLVFLIICGAALRAQTWDGSASTSWNDANNWTPATVPSTASTVTIPNTVNKPVLANNVVIASITMNAGSALNFNGFTLASSADLNIQGASLNNTNGATDIVITITSAGGGNSNYFGSNTINDNITLNFNGSGIFYEGYQGGDIYNGNTNFNLNAAGRFYSSYHQKSSFNGNLTVTRTAAGINNLFNAGFNNITGNFNYTNNAGGDNYINSGGTASGDISGTINITTSGTGNPEFYLRKIKNLATGGTISVQNSGYTSIENDTLKVASLNVTGFSGASGDGFSNCVIIGNVSFAEAAANTGSVYFGGNIITGNTSITTNSAVTWYEGYQVGDVYNGNINFNLNGAGRFYSSYHQKSSFNGNFTVTRTTAGITDLFNAGFNNITGNFSYTNNAGGDNYINSGGTASGAISGTVNISAGGTGNPPFYLRRIKNLTTGGTISVQNSGYTLIDNDTLKVASLNVAGFTGASGDEFSNCVIIGNVSFAEAAANTGSVYFGGNVLTGNTNITTNSAVAWYEGYQVGDIYNGNTTFTLNGTGRFYSSYHQKSSFNGNLTLNRTGIGITDLFNAGFNNITGNFSYTNNAGGDNYINSGGTASGAISGTVNITAGGTGNPPFYLRRIKNLTTGGTISVQNSGYVLIENDTLAVASLNVNGFTGASGDELSRCVITGNVSFAEAATNTGSVYIGGNIITGNTTMTTNTAVAWYESYQSSDIYNGNVSFTRNSAAGILYIAYHDTTYANQNLVFNSPAGINVNTAIQFGGSTNGIIEQLGAQPITIPGLIMNKTGGASLTLNDSVTVTTSAAFISGNMYSSSANNLIFPDNISYTGASAASHVIGPVTKIGDEVFTFPVGTPVSYNPVTISAPVGATSKFRAEYKNQNPTINGFNTNSKAASFGSAIISNAGYWDVQRLTGTTNVTLTLGYNTNPYELYPVPANLKVAHWNGTQWDDHGNGGNPPIPATAGTVVNSVAITTFSPFAIAGVIPTYFFTFSQPGPGPDGTPIKLSGIGGWPGYMVKQLPGGAYTADTIFLVPNGSTNTFRLKDLYGVEKDTTITVGPAPVNYITANGSGSINFKGWRHFVYLKTAGNNIMGAIADNNLTLGITTMNTYFSAANVSTSPNGNIYLKRSFKITSELNPVGTRRVRFYITKTEFTNLQAADPTAFPSGINSVTITRYNGPEEAGLFNPLPGGNAVVIPASAVTIADLGTMYSLDVDVSSFGSFYIGGNISTLNICSGSGITLQSNITGSTYQWQADNGSGFANITNGGAYSGVTTSSLVITNAAGNLYGYKFRVRVNGSTFSQVYTLKFNATWLGTVSTAWENPANWSCGQLPDGNTDVIVNGGRPFYPQLNSNTSIRSWTLNPGASGTINPGFKLTILK